MSINVDKVKRVLAGEILSVTVEEHKYILQCLLKKAHDITRDQEERNAAALQILTYTEKLAKFSAPEGNLQPTEENILSIGAVAGAMKNLTFLNLYLSPSEEWITWTDYFVHLVNGNKEVHAMEYSDVELPA